MNPIHHLRPKLIAHRQFMIDLTEADVPCFALGVVEERGQQVGCLALRPDVAIPPEVSAAGFGFGHALLGADHYEVVQLAFDFYGFRTYNVLLNPSVPLVRHVLALLLDRGDYITFVLDLDRHANAFRADISEDNLAGLRAHFPRLQNSATTDAQYQRAVSSFDANPQPRGAMLNWVCRANTDYLDVASDPLDLTPS